MACPTPKLSPDQPSLENALRDALKSILEKDGGSDPRTRFYSKFKEEVAEHDDDPQKKHDEDLNTALIFSGLFSAVTSAFIIDIQSELKPDYEEMNNTLLELLLNATIGNTPPGQATPLPRWSGPDPAIRQVQATLYATLCATLFAAFLATLGKQWLNRYGQTDTHGSIEDRCRDRERKLSGLERWHFHLIIRSASLTIQGSLALLGSALSRYLWEVDRTVSSVVIGFTSLGCVLYIAIVMASVLSFDCPFHTPVSSLICFATNAIKLWWQEHHGKVVPNLADLAEGTLSVGVAPFHGLQHRVFHSLLSPSWEKGYRFDARCITRMLVLSTDVNTIRLTMDFVQEVIWDAGIKNVPLGWIYAKLINCFDFTHPRTPILIPALRDVAYLSAKAFTHIQVQRYCVSRPGSLAHVDESWRTDTKHIPLGSLEPRGDPDLESTLLMVDKAFGRDVEIPWDEYRLGPTHHSWISHLFIYYAWRDPDSDDASVLVKYSLDSNKSPDDTVIADCLYIIKIMIGGRPPIEDLTRRDKSREINIMVDEIFLELSKRFQGPFPTNVDASKRPLRALKFITRLSTATVATKSYELFGAIMKSSVAQEKKMEAARLALHATYQSGPKPIPPVGDHRHIFDFLYHHTGRYVKREPLRAEEFEWWYGVLWVHYEDLDPGVRSGLDEITNGTDRVDPERCKTAIEEEIGRVKELDGVINTAILEEAYSKLSAFIDRREQLPVPPIT